MAVFYQLSSVLNKEEAAECKSTPLFISAKRDKATTMSAVSLAGFPECRCCHTVFIPTHRTCYNGHISAAYLVIVRAAIHGRLFVGLVSGAGVLPHHAVEIAHAAHVHAFVLHHPCSCLHGAVW